MVGSLQDRGVQMLALNVKKDQRACRVAGVLVLLVFMVSVNFDVTIQLQRILFSEFSVVTSDAPNRDHAHGLLDKLRETARLAADGQDYTFTAAERAAWHERHPCQSRSELPAIYAARKHIKDISPNEMWPQVLDEYSNLHRICIKRVGNLTHHFLNKSNVTIPGCKFLLAEGKYGLGNKFLVTMSAMLYAIVSQRVMLVPSVATYKTIFCEPFVGSSWFLNEDNFPMPGPDEHNNSWVEGPTFTYNLNNRLNLLKEEQRREDDTETRSEESLPPLVDAIAVSAIWPHRPWFPDKWFFCNTEQKYLAEVPWMYFSGCIYSIPDLFGSAPFSATLQSLFPDRMVSTRLLRSSFLPSDSVWSRFKHLNHVYFEHADRRVGIQLRFFQESHDAMSAEMNHRVLDCVIKNGVLPDRTKSPTDDPISPPSSAPVTKVFIASLYSDLHDHLREFYLRNPTETGEAVGVLQMTSRQEQYEGEEVDRKREEDREAFVEMLILSLSDSLVVTPVSTFGQVGQAYGGLTPWIVRVTEHDAGPSCERGQTVDPCQQNDYPGYSCENDGPPRSPEWDGLLELCMEIDHGNRIASGVQILDNHRPWQEAQGQRL